nr:MAG TPA: hypothetical protein [Caudoviricetes sp.]
MPLSNYTIINFVIAKINLKISISKYCSYF